MPPCCSAGGIFSVALSVTQPHRIELCSTPHHLACNSALRQSLRGRPLALPGALPSCPEAAVRQLRGCSSPALASLRRRCPDFPPAPSCGCRAKARPLQLEPAFTRPARHFQYSSIFLRCSKGASDEWRSG